MNELTGTVLIGIGATATMDLWGLARRPLLGMPPPDYALVGRWVGHLCQGRLRHPAIARAAAVPGERGIGWAFHYLTGIAFAAILVTATHGSWLADPTIPAAMVTGIGTLAAPFLIMQPAMGAGIAASRTPRPAHARLQSLTSHVAYGVGLFLAGDLLLWLQH